MIAGDVGDITASIETGISIAKHSYIEHFIIPRVHDDVLRAVRGCSEVEDYDALGVIESFSVSALIEGADAARKAANVSLLEIRVAMALGGKAFVTLTGTVADVNAAVEVGARVVGEHGMLVNKVVIPRPHQKLYSELI
jgi:microcompartment protein CcmL/EutN